MKTILFLSSVLFFIGSSLIAQTTGKLIDTNGDGTYDVDEFSSVYSKGYNDWDTDGDGKINNQEFYDNNYNRLDVNHDGRLTNEEWTGGERDFEGFIPDDRKAQKQPKYLTKKEFADRFKDGKYYNSYDINKDGFIDANEMSQINFNRLDKNHDGKLDDSELEGNQ